MSYPVLICVDPEEMAVSENSYRVCSKERVDMNLRDLSRQWPHSKICIYKLSEIQMIKEMPKFVRYICNDEGEIVPA